ncbi:helix-turn-helix domain-containing protein [bacterium]|nr:helix-turn-helix domain-containing protein [bacterium]
MNSIDIDKLAEMIRQKRNNRNLRETAAEIGDISISTLSRVEQGRVPDINTFFTLCTWLRVNPNDFSNMKVGDSPKEQILYHLRADNTLPPNVNEALVAMIELAYKNSETLGSRS